MGPDAAEPSAIDPAAMDPGALDPSGDAGVTDRAEGTERDRDLVALEDAERELADLEDELGGTEDTPGA